MTAEEFSKALTFLGVAYNKEFTNEQAKIWYEFFKTTSEETFKKAIKRLIATNKFMPSIAEINQEIALIDNPHLGLNPLKEWEEVLRLIRKYGYYKTNEALAEMNLLTRNVVEQLGWSKLCMSEDIVWLKKEFIEIFKNKQQGIESLEMLAEPVMTMAELAEKALEYGNKETKLLETIE